MLSLQRVLISAATLLLPAFLVCAQFSLRSDISGVVTDQNGDAVPNASVTLTDRDRAQTTTATTDTNGLYRFVNLNTGRYEVAVEQDGFKRAVSGEIQLATQQSARVDIKLQIGGVTELVEVETTGALLNQDQPVLGSIVDRHFIEKLPATGRNFSNFGALAPNISVTEVRGALSTADSAGARHVGGGIKFRSGAGGDNDYSINGINANDNFVDLYNYAPSLEAVAEVKVDVANFSAEFGRNASNVNAATRGGSNQFHGSGFDFIYNSALNAWNPFQKINVRPGTKKPLLQQNQFGGNLGGPVRIPKIFDGRNRAFFFVNYERTIRNSQGNPRIVRVPTEAERKGDFSELLRRFPNDPNVVLYNPYSTVVDKNGNTVRTPIPNNDLRLATKPDGSPLIDPRAQALVGLFPLPNGYRNPSDPNDLRNFQGNESRGFDAYRFDSRFDYRFSEADSLFVTIAKSHGLDENSSVVFPFLPADPSNWEDSNFFITGNYVHVFNPRLTNELIIGYSRPFMTNADQSTKDYQARTDTPYGTAFKNVHFTPIKGYELFIDGYPTLGVNPFNAVRPTSQFSDNVVAIRGSHAFKGGINFIRKRDFGEYIGRFAVYDTTFTRAGSANGSIGGDSMATFLTGVSSYLTQQYQIEGGYPSKGTIFSFWGGFFEDRWQVNPKLTLTLGLRYDLEVPYYSADRAGNSTLDTSFPGWRLLMPGRAEGVPARFASPDKNNFGPRLSFAYQLRDDVVLRGGYGNFYVVGSGKSLEGRLDGIQGTNFAYNTQEFTNGSVGLNDDIPYFTLDRVFPAPTTLALDRFPVSTAPGVGWFCDKCYAGISYRDQESEIIPYYHRYTIEVQKSLGAKTSVTLSYLGEQGRQLPYTLNINNPPYRTGWASSTQVNAARPNNAGRWGDVRVARHGLNSSYNGGTIRVDRRLSRGLQLLAHYTFSKAINESGDWAYNRYLSRGEASFSHPHRFVSAVTYETPRLRSSNAFLRTLLAGWELGIITSFESGDALSVTNTQTSARDREPNVPNLIRDPNLPRDQRTPTRWFDAAAFVAPPQDVKGNAGRGIVRGPGTNNWNISLGKVFRPLERLNMEVRADMFNAFNHPQWLNVNTAYSVRPGNTFGRARGARDARIIQLGLKLSF